MLLGGPTRKRDARLKRCFLRVDRAWGDDDLDDLEQYATAWLCEHLRKERDAFAARGRVVHHEDTKIEQFEVVAGGGPDDQDCLARVTSTSKHWVTDAVMSQQMTGTPTGERVTRYWRFVRDATHGWLADEIGVAAPPGMAPSTLPEPI